MRLLSACLGLVLAWLLCTCARADSSSDDPFLWLEELHGARALSWVRAQNAFTLNAQTADSDYADTLEDARRILSSRDRIPYGDLMGGYVYNFWQEPGRRGVWRRASLASYQDDDPAWETLIDFDAPGAGRENWVWKGAQCLPPAFARCLIKVSRGNEAIVVREFDVASHSFVRGGFEIGEAKTEAAWVDINTIMVATNWGGGAVTRSGRPRFVKRLSRGQTLPQAQTLFEGGEGDVGATPVVTFDASGRAERFIVRAAGFSNSELYYVDPNWRLARIAAPPFAEFKGLHKRQLLFTLSRDWRTSGRVFAQGSLISFSLDGMLQSGGRLPDAKALFTPNVRMAIDTVATSRDAVYISLFENVLGRIHEVTFDGAKWASRRIGLPENGTVRISAASDSNREVMFKFESFLIPDRLYLLGDGGRPQLIKEASPRFDSFGLEVRQYEAASIDGAKIPYFLVRQEDTLANGRTPVLLYAYGGFQIPTTPWYWSAAGKLWLERGGAYAIANVRGGGEFGRRWHEAAKGANRQRNFDDLIAVARNMIARGFTSPQRLGLMGDAQGGLLAVGAFVQHPELFNAVAARAPLTDMLRYVHLPGGANWIDEYGDPRNPPMRSIIARWSPYQNLRAGVKYPRPFFMTSTGDERVHPAHARKMAAKMQALGQPYFYFEQPGAPSAQQRAEQLALTYTYFRRQLME